MSSATYKIVERHGFEPLGSHGWLHGLRTGQLVIPDINEKGGRGSILHLFMGVDRLKWPSLASSVKSEDLHFYPDPPHEALIVWLLDKGADPWERHEGKNAWSEAIYRGWPSVMRYLCARSDAPPREILEQEPIFREYAWGGKEPEAPLELLAPAAFAERNQVEALKAWAELGLSVNLGVGSDINAGTRARTPEFLKEWVSLGGDITAKLPSGKPLKDAWRFSNTAHQVAMERVWVRHQPPDVRRVDDRIDEALAIILKCSPKTLVTHRLRELGLSASSARENGVLMRDLWAEAHLKNPRRTAPAVALMLLEDASDEVVWEAVVAGLKSAKNAPNQFFPTPKHLEELLSSNRFGPVSQVLYRLADELTEYPSALDRLFWYSRGHFEKLFPDTPEAVDKPAMKRHDILVKYWGQWFFHSDDPPGQSRGWHAFSAWMGAEIRSSFSFDIYRSILSASGEHADKAAQGMDLLIAAQAWEDWKKARPCSLLLRQWEEGGTMGWVEGYSLQTPGSAPQGLADAVWKRVLEGNKPPSYQEEFISLKVLLDEKRMDLQISPSESSPSRASRFRF